MVVVYYVLHVLGAFLLLGLTFHACAAPRPEARRPMLAATGVLAVVVLVGGFGLLARLHANTFHPWVWIKLACWLVLAALAGFAFRRPERASGIAWVAAAVVAVAVWAVYARPFV